MRYIAAKRPIQALIDNDDGPCTIPSRSDSELGYMVCRKNYSKSDAAEESKLRKNIRDTAKKIQNVSFDASNRPLHRSENDWLADFESANCLANELVKLNTDHQSIAHTYTHPYWLPLPRI